MPRGSPEEAGVKIYVMVDLEGISGVTARSQVLPEEPRFAEGRRFMTADINACVDGLARAGATEIVVYDCHGGSYTAIWDGLDPRAEYIQGETSVRMPYIDGAEGLVLLGYHAMAGTPQAVLEHTMSSIGWQNFWLNGSKAGELAIDAGIAGDYGVPTIMASGCDKLCAEARALIPGIHTAEVKTALSIFGARLLPAERAHALITETAAAAVRGRGAVAPFRPARPVTMRLERVSRGTPPFGGTRPWMRQIDARTFEVTGDSVEEAFNRLTR
jgi:D-amino peptidase